MSVEESLIPFSNYKKHKEIEKKVKELLSKLNLNSYEKTIKRD